MNLEDLFFSPRRGWLSSNIVGKISRGEEPGTYISTMSEKINDGDLGHSNTIYASANVEGINTSNYWHYLFTEPLDELTLERLSKRDQPTMIVDYKPDNIWTPRKSNLCMGEFIVRKVLELEVRRLRKINK